MDYSDKSHFIYLYYLIPSKYSIFSPSMFDITVFIQSAHNRTFLKKLFQLFYIFLKDKIQISNYSFQVSTCVTCKSRKISEFKAEVW